MPQIQTILVVDDEKAIRDSWFACATAAARFYGMPGGRSLISAGWCAWPAGGRWLATGWSLR